MSKRTLRRAAERQARKAERKLQLAAQALTGIVASAAHDNDELLSAAEIQSPEFLTAEDRTTEQLPNRPATPAQIAANRENAKFSSGPTSTAGKATVSQNRRTHGLAGRFTVLAWEDAGAFQTLAQSFYAEHNPETDNEQRLVDSLIQHYWLTQRAIRLQEDLIAKAEDPTAVDGKKLSLFLRYQTTHERSYYKVERELHNLKKLKRQDEIGFESQNRRQEAHEARVRLTHARAANLEIDTAARQVMEAPLPGNTRLSFEQLTKACSTAIATLVYENQFKTAA